MITISLKSAPKTLKSPPFSKLIRTMLFFLLHILNHQGDPPNDLDGIMNMLFNLTWININYNSFKFIFNKLSYHIDHW